MNIAKKFSNVPIFDDVRELRGEEVGAVDIIFGGFPCQPFSVAGNRKGQTDERHLFPEFSRLVGEIKPRWVVAENVVGILSLAADEVCSELERLGYAVGIWNYEAAAVGAPHRRARVFFVAHSTGERSNTRRSKCAGFERSIASIGSGSFISHSTGERREAVEHEARIVGEGQGERKSCTANSASDGFDWWSVEPGVGRMVDGISNRVDRIRALGNAVVPAQIYPLFKAIIEIERGVL